MIVIITRKKLNKLKEEIRILQLENTALWRFIHEQKKKNNERTTD